jgi:hypothetical protein
VPGRVWKPRDRDDARLVILTRHGRHRNGVLTHDGCAEVRSIARALEQYLHESDRAHWPVHLYFSRDRPGDRETERSAIEIARTLGCPPARPPVQLTRADDGQPVVGTDGRTETGSRTWLGAYDDRKALRALVGASATFLRSRDLVAGDGVRVPSREAVVVLVGNDPFVTWLGRELGSAVHLGHGEMAAFEPRRSPWTRWRLLFTLCHTDPDLTAALREKVRSKMDVAKVYGALGAGLLTFVVERGLQRDSPTPGWTLAASMALAVGTALYLCTLFAYDRLLMPTELWAGRVPRRPAGWVVHRPPSSDRWVIFQNMQHIWRWLFLPGCLAIAGGIVLLALPSFDQASPRWAWAAGAVASLALTAFWAVWHRPRLGAED